MNIDFHSHILPAADHGSDGLATSLKQVALAKNAGLDVLAATPHFYPDREDAAAFLHRRERCAALLRQELPSDSPRLLVGAEVHLCRGLHNLPELHRLCLEGTRVLLLELPPVRSLARYEETLTALLEERGLTVVLAHIDRYSPSIFEPLLESGFLAQLNADAIVRLWTRRCCLRWAERSCTVALGSDLHGTELGYRNFHRAAELLGRRYNTLMRRTERLLPPPR